MKKGNEPEVFKRGKKFHKQIQDEWGKTNSDGKVLTEHVVKIDLKKKNYRFDILIDELGNNLKAVVEIKSTNWNNIKRSNIRRYVRKHIRQIWKYINLQEEFRNFEISAGVIYPKTPSDPAITELIESMFNEEGIQVVWHDESVEESKARNISEDINNPCV